MRKMTFRYITCILIAVLCTTCQAQDAQPETPSQNKNSGDSLTQKASYLLGFNFVRNMQMQGFDCDLEALMKGINDAAAKKQPPMTAEEIQSVQRTFERMMVQKQQERLAKAADENMRKGVAFLKENALKEGVKELESGIQYRVLKPGEGTSPGPSDKVTLKYKAKFIDGTIFDASEESAPWNITVGAIGVRGIVNAIQKMKPGSVWEVFIPSALGFGIQGDPSGVVGPNQVLIYELELLDVDKK